MKRLLRPICWFHTARFWLKDFLTGKSLKVLTDGHLRELGESHIKRGRRYQPEVCMRCGDIDNTGWTRIKGLVRR